MNNTPLENSYRSGKIWPNDLYKCILEVTQIEPRSLFFFFKLKAGHLQDSIYCSFPANSTKPLIYHFHHYVKVQKRSASPFPQMGILSWCIKLTSQNCAISVWMKKRLTHCTEDERVPFVSLSLVSRRNIILENFSKDLALKWVHLNTFLML